MREQDRNELLRDLERRALEEADLEEPPPLDVIAAAVPPSDAQASAAGDITLAGYLRIHNRPPAFEGSDGQPYTVDVDTEQDEENRWAGFLVFLRWAETGAGIMDHMESGDVAYGASDEEARAAARELSLYELKAELDAAIERRRSQQEE